MGSPFLDLRHIHPCLPTRTLQRYKCGQCIETSWQFINSAANLRLKMSRSSELRLQMSWSSD
jgi:hypothetical protein